MMRVAVVAGLIALAVAIGLWVDSCSGGGGKHKALCWQPSYAKTHTLHNDKTFRNLGHELPLGSRHCRS